MGKPWLEGFKFATYLSIPIVLTVAFAANPANLESIIRNVRGLCDCVFVIVSTDGCFLRRTARVRGVSGGGSETTAE